MSASKKLFAILSASAYANAFINFNVDPTCVPDEDIDDETFEMILPFFCKFEEDADYDPGFDCTDLPEECEDDIRKKALWAGTKRHAESQGTIRPGCRDSFHLSREVEYPECVFGRPVPELRVLELMDSAWDAREFAEKVLSSNPTSCAARMALQAYAIFGEISRLRVSIVARHGRMTDYDSKLQKIVDGWDASSNECKEPWRLEAADDTTNRLAARDWAFSRKVLNTEECTVLRHYDGSSFAKPHDGSFDGCKAECDLEPECNAFNMDLRFTITMKNAQCDLLKCPSGVAKLKKFGYVSFSRVTAPSPAVDPSPELPPLTTNTGDSESGPNVIDANNCEECGSDRECCRKNNGECAMKKSSGMCVERNGCASRRSLSRFMVSECGPKCCADKPDCTWSGSEKQCKSS